MTFDLLTLTLAAAILESGDRASEKGPREDPKYYANRAGRLLAAVAAKSAASPNGPPPPSPLERVILDPTTPIMEGLER